MRPLGPILGGSFVAYDPSPCKTTPDRSRLPATNEPVESNHVTGGLQMNDQSLHCKLQKGHILNGKSRSYWTSNLNINLLIKLIHLVELVRLQIKPVYDIYPRVHIPDRILPTAGLDRSTAVSHRSRSLGFHGTLMLVKLLLLKFEGVSPISSSPSSSTPTPSSSSQTTSSSLW